MMEWVRELPLLWAVAFLYVVIWLRAGGTYLVGRGARRAANRGRIAAFLESDGVQRATDLVNRWGAPVVALSFLTVGFQTAANAAAGLTAMPLRRYLPALAVGGLAWATLYATVGLVAVMAWFELFVRSPWAAVAVLALIVALIAVLLRHKRRTGGLTKAATSTGTSAPGVAADADAPAGRVPESSEPDAAGAGDIRPSSPAPGRRSHPRSGGRAARTR